MTPGRIWLAWLAANTIPSIVVLVVVAVLRNTLGTNELAVLAYALLFGLVAWLQARVWVLWRLLRPHDQPPRAARWVGWTIGGLIAAMFFGVGTLATIDGLGHETLGLVSGWLLAGLVLGTVQSFALAVTRLHAVLWIAACASGWAAAAMLYSYLIATHFAQIPVLGWLARSSQLEGNVELTITVLTFIVYGVATGAVLRGLTPKP